MIGSFRHKGLERLFVRDDASGVDPRLAPKLRRMLTQLAADARPAAFGAPGRKLHELKGDRKGFRSATVSGNWRLTFRIDDADAYDVDLEDYL